MDRKWILSQLGDLIEIDLIEEVSPSNYLVRPKNELRTMYVSCIFYNLETAKKAALMFLEHRKSEFVAAAGRVDARMEAVKQMT